MTTKRKIKLAVLGVVLVFFLPTCKMLLHTIGYLPGTERVVVVQKVPMDDADRWKTLFGERIKDTWIEPVGFPVNDKTGTKKIVIDGNEARTRQQGGVTQYKFHLITSGLEGVYLVDMDSDGIDDLVFFDVGDKVVRILYRNTRGRFHRRQSIEVRHGGGVVEDVNEDGQPDLVLKLDSGYEAWLLERKLSK